MVIVKFHVTIRDQAIDLRWDERFSSVSSKFVDLKQQIGSAGTSARPPL